MYRDIDMKMHMSLGNIFGRNSRVFSIARGCYCCERGFANGLGCDRILAVERVIGGIAIRMIYADDTIYI